MEDHIEATPLLASLTPTPAGPSEASHIADERIPQSLERDAMTHPDVPLPNQSLDVEDLPLEVLQAICGLLIQEDSVNVSVLRRRHNGDRYLPSNKFMYGFPGSLTDLDGLLHTSPMLRSVALKTLGRTVTFYANSDTFTDFPLAFGPGNAKHITKLELQLFFHYKLRDEDT